MSYRSGDKYQKTPSPKAAVETASDRMLRETAAILTREKVFPKRSRWLFGQEIMRIANRYHTAVAYANGIRVTNHALFVQRYTAQSLAIAWLYALNVKMTAAQLCCSAPLDKFEAWSDTWAVADDMTKAWRAADVRRYEEQFGGLTADELGEASSKAGGVV